MSKPNEINWQALPHSVEAEHQVLGALLLDNEALYRVADLEPKHFYHPDHAILFAEIRRQIDDGLRCDPVTVFDVMQHKIASCLEYLNSLATSTSGSAAIERHASSIIEKAQKRALIALAAEISTSARSCEGADFLIDSAASRLEALARRSAKQEPARLADMLVNYTELLNDRSEGKIKVVRTGFKTFDEQLDGGLDRGTLTVIAGRPGMGKTALGLGLARNVAGDGTSLVLSMEMSRHQIIDRNISALGNLPLCWLKHPTGDSGMWARMTDAQKRAQDLNLFIDDQTALNLLDIRSKARMIKRKHGLDLLVIDQLSFITGSSEENKAYAVGEYTRGLIQLAKELDIAVVLLCQLNRDLEKRKDKRPIMADLAMSGSLEQDAANIIFLYRDVVYNPATLDKDVCEVLVAKQRQGEPGIVALAYIGEETRFADLPSVWKRRKEVTPPATKRGFD
jgi:replicative DNA helicase